MSNLKMTMDLNVLNHLGLNLYSNISSVLSEIVANAYDADATTVHVNLDKEENTITILDNGHGMTRDDVNKKFLTVGYPKRLNGETKSKTLGRDVMGRKGIGKLSLFSIAEKIEIHTFAGYGDNEGQKTGFILDIKDIKRDITNGEEYTPIEIPSDEIDISGGTKIIVSGCKSHVINLKTKTIKRKIARRFSVLGDEYNFLVKINNNQITYEDRDFINKVDFLWEIGDEENKQFEGCDFKFKDKLNGELNETYRVHGWIGTVGKPSDLRPEDDNNNKISIICRGKMAQDDILKTFNEGGIYSTYLIGEVHADFLDLNDEDDIATSSRQSINEEDERYVLLTQKVLEYLKTIQRTWTIKRLEISEATAVENAKKISPAIVEWFDTLKTEGSKKHAKKLFATIDNLHFDGEDEIDKKRELYYHGILAFEKLKLNDSLHELDKLDTSDAILLTSIFNELNDIEANQYHSIVNQRVKVLQAFHKSIKDNDLEVVLQNHLFKNLWLLNPSWERPTEGTEVMEQSVKTEFDKVITSLTKEERKARVDVKYRTAAGDHIIVELKRYNTSYKINAGILFNQMNKYTRALKKCLLETEGISNNRIKGFVIIGDGLSEEEFQSAKDILKEINTTILRYDQLLDESFKSYRTYLEKHQEVNRIYELIQKI